MAKIFSVPARLVLAHVVDPTARFLLRRGVTPNAVTVAGTAGVVIGALALGARGHLVAGALVVTFFALTDMLDGTMARMRGPAGNFGALLDSSMDRLADAAVFGAVIFYLYGQDNPYNGIVAGLICLSAGQVVSYVKARAQSLGLNADVGLAERAERLILVGVGGLLTGFGLDWGLPAALWLLAVLSLVTVFQRLIAAARSDKVPTE
ncbi:phosphatidylinositol phosphate synthase [Actinoplanes sp. NBRC 103695]|uniref:phosphatidylinositol phosphate synthase n=1 Tax=Actinoplanes sp. NBRC 103695 TaxID=3032202 RepID=UPI0024A36820|nr:CDP-alcohol phosphatidyltransferase family protein [Actinoplanes sp. NBRC 103695]GLY96009.1 putative phosphatidylinositol synthase PgsA [Actinoplanes sp. NBRC 103695]